MGKGLKHTSQVCVKNSSNGGSTVYMYYCVLISKHQILTAVSSAFSFASDQLNHSDCMVCPNPVDVNTWAMFGNTTFYEYDVRILVLQNLFNRVCLSFKLDFSWTLSCGCYRIWRVNGNRETYER